MAAIEQPVNKRAFARTYKETNDLSTEAEDNISFQELYYWPNIDCIYIYIYIYIMKVWNWALDLPFFEQIPSVPKTKIW